LAACNPYDNRSGEYYAGAVNAELFQAAYVGKPASDGTPTMRPSTAYVKDATAPVGYKQISYFAFPFPDPPEPSDDASIPPYSPLALDTLSPDGKQGTDVPKGYLFDPRPPVSPFPDKERCAPPKGYVFDQRTEAYRRDQQGNIFSLLPDDPGYVPVVAEVPVESAGEPCQDIKSVSTLLRSDDVKVPAQRPPGESPITINDGKFLAWAIVDPGTDVLPIGANGLGPQRWGWFDHYLLAYLDGGYIPTKVVPQAGNRKEHVEMVPQNLYFPTRRPKADPTGNVVAVAGHVGDGFDIFDAARSDAAYSPVCHVFSFEPTDPMHLGDCSPPLTDPKACRRSVDRLDMAEIASLSRPEADNGFIFCLQVQ
jgi:hypothetical protein